MRPTNVFDADGTPHLLTRFILKRNRDDTYQEMEKKNKKVTNLAGIHEDLLHYSSSKC